MLPSSIATSRRGRLAVALLAVLLALPVLAGLGSPPARAATPLTGLFKIDAGHCGSSSISGSYFRMILSNGGPDGPYLSNSNSGCSDQSFTPLTPGTDGGLRTGGGYQPPPSPAFDSGGNARSGTITGPTKFYGTNFATGTNATDPQTGTKVPAPTITADGNRLGGDLRAFAVTWNKQNFNQGAPKPNGSTPGNTRAVSGTYDASSGHFTLDWTSTIVGGPFNNFTGKWHLEGTFVPSRGAAPAGGSGGSGGSAAKAGSAAQGAAAGTPQGSAAQPVPGAPAGAAGAPGAGGDPSSASSGAAAPGGAPGAPSPSAGAQNVAAAAGQPVITRTISSKAVWSVSKLPLILAIALGVLALIAFLGLGRLDRKGRI